MRILLVLCALASVTGCQPGGGHVSEAEDPFHDLDHEAPPHRPADFGSAVAQLHQRTQDLPGWVRQGPEAAAQPLGELQDIVRWLPEIAGDSDMPEAEWNRVLAASRQLAHWLEQIKRQPPASPREPLTAALAELDQVAAADHWKTPVLAQPNRPESGHAH